MRQCWGSKVSNRALFSKLTRSDEYDTDAYIKFHCLVLIDCRDMTRWMSGVRSRTYSSKSVEVSSTGRSVSIRIPPRHDRTRCLVDL